MPDVLRDGSDERLARVLRARLERDPAFRESLARVVVADKPTYEKYVQRKRHEGGPVLPREEWEAYVFGEAGPGEKDTPGSRERAVVGPRLPRLFPWKETAKLPKWAAQSQSSPDRLFAQAKEAYPQMLDWLDRGEGVDKAIGAHVVRRDRDPDAKIDLDKEGPLMVIAPNKRKAEAVRKVEQRYGGDWREGAVDLVRASIAVDRYDQLPEVVEALKKSGLELAARPRNRFRKPTQGGYRDVVLNARLPNGHVMELQLHLKSVLKAKDEAHPIYSRIKGLDDKIAEYRKSKRSGKKPKVELSQDEMKLFDEATRQMRQVFESAWQASAPDEPREVKVPSLRRRKLQKSRRKRLTETLRRRSRVAQQETLYYSMDGLPVRWTRPNLPMVEGGEEPYPVDSMAFFAEQGVPIDEDEFDEMVRWRRRTGDGKKAFHDAVRDLCKANPEFRRALRAALSEG